MSPKYDRPVRISPAPTINPPPREGVATPGTTDEPKREPEPKKGQDATKEPESKLKDEPKNKGM
jgi:hypothetical protein